MDPIELLGFLSACLALVGFVGNEYGRLQANTVVYDVLNFGSAVGLFIYALAIHGWPFVLTNIVWATVSFLDLAKVSRRRRSRRYR